MVRFYLWLLFIMSWDCFLCEMQLFYCRLFDQTATDGEKKALEEAEERIRQIEDEHRTR